MDLDLQNHVALVTGGASGIGRAVAEGFAAEGADVEIWDLAKDVASVAGAIGKRFDCKAAGRVVDVSAEKAVNEAADKMEAEFGRIDHFVHCAAIGSGEFGFPFTNLKPADWSRVLDVNIMGMVHAAHRIAPGMRERGSGTMLFIASVAGQIGSQTDPPYSASKAANINFAQCMAKDLAPHNVRVNVICPGMVKTPLNQSVWRAWNERQPDGKQQSYQDWADEKIRTIVPLGKWQTPADIADMALFLSSRRANHVTGQTINVDGGYVMHW